MAISSFGKILTVLDLFSVSRPVINVDIICEELGLSKPTSYRYLKELVSADLLKRINGTSGDYTLGSKIAVLDYVSRTTDPLVKSVRRLCAILLSALNFAVYSPI
jgi:DNA-binding IclR family transcriptional regulator